MEYYVKSTEAEAQVGVDAINNSGWFPVTGNVKGQPAPDNQKTLSWCAGPRELTNGKWAWPRVPESKLDLLNVPQEERDAYLTAFGDDIQELQESDFVPMPSEET